MRKEFAKIGGIGRWMVVVLLLCAKCFVFDSKMVVEKGQQVDIFSTVLPIIGQEDYFWKGMGHDLMKEHSSDETEYFLRQQLSDKLIRMNYFEK